MTATTSKADAPGGFITAKGYPAPEGVEEVWLDDVDGLKVRMAMAPPASGVIQRGAVLLCTGYNEFIEKYFEAARTLQQRGFAVVLFDWPGQGASMRLHPNTRYGHILSHDINVDAQRRVLSAMKQRFSGPSLIMAHSMGGAVTTETLRRGVPDIAAAMLSAPMLGLRASFPQKWLARFIRAIGFGGAPIQKTSGPETFETNPFTHDRPRWQMKIDLLQQRPEYHLVSPTFAWVNAALDLYKVWNDRGAFNDFSTPTIVTSASEDKVVNNGAQGLIVAKMGAKAKFVPIIGARHEILMETDEIQAPFWVAFDGLCKDVGV